MADDGGDRVFTIYIDKVSDQQYTVPRLEVIHHGDDKQHHPHGRKSEKAGGNTFYCAKKHGGVIPVPKKCLIF
ncbi:MAG: hypothetical protein LBB60_00320 [Desulfovibrio sp.]|nr:hypothetical protein [Desulfovibrio sp.]